ncbi:Ribosomal protein L22/L17, conserved site [Penicillium camemberti]|uniref:Ribosomal protein L22/L17, conserved site n=1 Tax=Penicillium camemberti (strain FM 013) TaxID=1429867 RepID=A0A0G4PD24_PENC3|nr:Ribosomal protein L22/L17, conserved site [Penicillium camemberti]
MDSMAYITSARKCCEGSQAWVMQAPSRYGQLGCGRARGRSGLGDSSPAHLQSPVAPVSGEPGKNVEAEPTEPAVEASQGQGPQEDWGD